MLALSLLAVLLVAGLVALNWFFARQFGTGADFLPTWNGARAFLFADTDPYSQAVSQQTQLAVYERAARTGEFPYALDVPFPLLLVYAFPLFLYQLFLGFLSLIPVQISIPIPDASWTLWMRALWMTLSEFGIGFLVYFSLRLADWAPRRWFSVLLLAFALTWFYAAVALLDGSFSILLALILVGALLAMRGFNDELAGFLLAISALKWEATLLPWVLLILAALTARRWRVFFGIGMTWFTLGVISFLVSPDWFWPYARAVASNWRAADSLRVTPARFLLDWFPNLQNGFLLFMISILLLILILEWFSALRGKDFRRVAWVFALALAIAPLLGFPNTFANLAPLIFSIVFILPFTWERWKKYPYLIISLILIFVFALPLALELSPIPSPLLADGLTFLLPPLLVIMGLYWIRWYVIRPPLTWLDGVKRGLQK
jgi:hypothetical protein